MCSCTSITVNSTIKAPAQLFYQKLLGQCKYFHLPLLKNRLSVEKEDKTPICSFFPSYGSKPSIRCNFNENIILSENYKILLSQRKHLCISTHSKLCTYR